MAKKILFTAAGLILVIGFLVGTKAAQISSMIAASKNARQPSDAVATFVAKKAQWRPSVSAVGSVTAVQGVTVSAQMAGNVAEIAFESGAIVKQGDLLLRLDTSVEEAQLRAAEAAVALAKLNIERAQDLLQKTSISQSEFDAADAQFKQASAQADNIRAVISKKTVRAPFAGRLGIRLVNLGQTLKEGEGIVSLQSMDPVYVNFFVPQQQLASTAVDQDVNVTSDAAPGKTLSGKVTAIASEIDAATRNVKIQATLANAEGLLRPGMFVNVNVFETAAREVTIVPATAVIFASYGNSVFVVEKGQDGALVAKQHFVQLGERRGDFVEITQGVEAGAEVVSTGAFKLRNGSPVNVDNSKVPAASENPKPADA
ncbi:MAG: efflux RND transporter periplasmic adaptor subunit [Nibricoccus sp.]